MSPELIAILAVGASIFGFMWTLHRDVADVRERLARLEGTVDVLAKFLIDRERGREANP